MKSLSKSVTKVSSLVIYISEYAIYFTARDCIKWLTDRPKACFEREIKNNFQEAHHLTQNAQIVV